MEQIIFNLVLNALEAFPEGGTVTVTLSRAPESLILNVADNGCGGTIFRIILIAKQP
ncbi:MAG: ATP-binding protein [Desulfocapsaceae bacterium]|nr:ATP-binding protein [Desulfocapsaceae bacterium]